MKVPTSPVLFAFVLLCLATMAEAKELVLVERGESLAPIVVFENAPPKTRRAADELAEYFEKVSGARPHVIEGLPDPIPERAVWVGYQPILDELFPDLDFDFQNPEEILVAANENHLVIAGRDIWDPDRLVVDGGTWMSGYPRSTIVGKQQEYGTVNGVYTFIQDHLGVRWLWPGELGEDIPKRNTIAFVPFEHRHHPVFRERTLLRLSSLGDRRGRSHEWSRLQRLQLISLLVPGGHPFEDWWERFHEKHPEYFALQPDGTRSGFPRPVDAKLCLSNPGVWDQWLADVEKQIEQNPARTVFDGSENDSSNRGICVCEHCRAWDAQDAQPWSYAWEGLTQEYVAMTDRYMTFWNILAERLKQRFPERELYVSGMVYGPARPAPVNVKLADNTLLSYVGSFPLTSEQRREGQKAEWLERAAIAPKMRYRPNIFFVGGGTWGWPEVAMTKTMEDFRFLADNQCLGLWVDTAPEHWATQGPQYYLMTQLLWDPHQDGNAVLDDYYRRGFGPAAEAIAQYWAMMEQANETFMSLPGLSLLTRDRHSRIPMAREHVYTPQFLAQAEAALRRAAALAEDGPPVYGQRVEFVRAGYEVLRLMMETVQLMERVRESDGRDAGAVRQALDNWEEMAEIAERAGPHAFRFEEIRSRMRGGYMGGVEDYLGPPAERFRVAAGLVPGADAEPEATAVAQPEAPAPRPAADFDPVPAEEAGWLPAFSDDFDRDELGDEWVVVEGNWEVADGHLRGSGTLMSAQGFPGFQRLEFEAVTDVTPFVFFEGAQPTVTVSDISSFIQAPADTEQPFAANCYFFQFGGFNNSRNRLARGGADLWDDTNPETRIVPDTPHRIVVENDEGRLRFIVDGNLLMERFERSPAVGPGQDRFGLYFYTAAKVRSVRLYVKPLAADDI